MAETTRYIHGEHEVKVDTIYRVGKLKMEGSHQVFAKEIQEAYEAAKIYPPENVFLRYTTMAGKYERISLKEAEMQDTCKTIKAIIATGSCILQGRNDPDREGLCDILCLGIQKPTQLLSNRGQIFSQDSTSQIKCRRICDLMVELLK